MYSTFVISVAKFNPWGKLYKILLSHNGSPFGTKKILSAFVCFFLSFFYTLSVLSSEHAHFLWDFLYPSKWMQWRLLPLWMFISSEGEIELVLLQCSQDGCSRNEHEWEGKNRGSVLLCCWGYHVCSLDIASFHLSSTERSDRALCFSAVSDEESFSEMIRTRSAHVNEMVSKISTSFHSCSRRKFSDWGLNIYLLNIYCMFTL